MKLRSKDVIPDRVLAALAPDDDECAMLALALIIGNGGELLEEEIDRQGQVILNIYREVRYMQGLWKLIMAGELVISVPPDVTDDFTVRLIKPEERGATLDRVRASRRQMDS